MDTLIEAEVFPYNILEDVDGRLRLSGIYQLSDTKNRNKRVYPRGLWEKVLEGSSDFRKRLDARLVLGEMGHPSDGKTRLSNVSHLITKVWMEEGYKPECVVCQSGAGPHVHIMAEEEVLNTPEGKILQELYRAGVQLGVSSRGQGSVRGGTGEQLVADDFRLETFDHVLDPSTPGAYPKVISESVIEAVEKFVTPACTAAELQGYRKILSEVGEEGSEKVGKLIETIDVRLGSGEEPKIFAPAVVPTVIPGQQAVQPVIYTIAPDASNTNVTFNPGSEKPESTEVDNMPEISLENPEVKSLVDREVASFREELEHRLAKAVAENDKLRAESADIEQKLEASNKLGEEMTTQLKSTNFQLEAFRKEVEGREDTTPMYDEEHTLEQAFEASKQVIEELLDRLDGYTEALTRADNAEMLMSETIERLRRRTSIEKIDNLLQHESAERVAQLRPLLLECASVEEIEGRYETLTQLAPQVVEATEEPVVQEDNKIVEGVLPEGAGFLSEENAVSLAEKMPTLDENTTINQDLSRRIMTRTFAGRA